VADSKKHHKPSLSLTLGVTGWAALMTILFGVEVTPISFFDASALLACAIFATSNTIFWLVPTSPAFTLRVQAIEIALIGIVSATVSSPESFGGILVFAVAIPLLAKSGLVESRSGLFAVLAFGLVIDTVLSWVLHSPPLRMVIGHSAISFGVLSVLVVAFYDEIRELTGELEASTRRLALHEKAIERANRELELAREQHEAAEIRLKEAEKRYATAEALAADDGAVRTDRSIDDLGLTPREQEVLRCLVAYRGRNRDIAHRLGISVRTVKAHIYNSCNKLGVDSRLELVELVRDYLRP
jgi:DNA-binding CsgD family transcriptional regulator